tara:strand:- start:1909 stop:2439 length:531 start_codon:yes stop_codon:yes gene_type:complete
LIKEILIFLLIIILSFKIHSKNIVVVNIDKLISTNDQYINIIKNIENDQNEMIIEFEITEQELSKRLSEINKDKLILDEIATNELIDKYNIDYEIFSKLVDSFNSHYQNQIVAIRNKILQELIVLLENYAIINQIDLILDSNSYLIASNNININELISKKLNKIDLKLDFESFENN